MTLDAAVRRAVPEENPDATVRMKEASPRPAFVQGTLRQSKTT